MADLVEQRADPVSAQDRADEALQAPRGDVAQAALIREYMTALVAEGRAAQHSRNGRELAIFETQFDVIARLVDALQMGNYRDTASRLAGLAPSSVRAWVKASDDGDRRYATVAALVRLAESIAEAEDVQNVRQAGKDPRFWAASMTRLERKHPEKWGRRQDSIDGPKVAVYIGGRPTDIQIAVSAPSAPASSALPAVGETARDQVLDGDAAESAD